MLGAVTLGFAAPAARAAAARARCQQVAPQPPSAALRRFGASSARSLGLRSRRRTVAGACRLSNVVTAVASEAAPQDEEEEQSEVALLQQKYNTPDGSVSVEEGLAGMTRVVLTHDSGSACAVYLLGANLTTWQLPNGSDVLYVREDAAYDGVTPVTGGVTICWPQHGRGGELAGGIVGQAPLPENGLVKDLLWELVETGVRDDNGAPFAILRCQETEATLAAWPHEFELFYEVSVGERDVSLSLLARNAGSERLSFTTSLQPHIGVTDATSTSVRMLGLTGSPYFDNSNPSGGKPRVRVEHEPAPSLPAYEGPTERLYINTQPRVALEVGTGCTVFVENTDGFTDHLVYNPGEAVPSFPNFVALGPAVVGRPVKLQPEEEWAGTCTLFIRDVVLSEKVVREFKEVEEAEKGPFQFPNRKAMVASRIAGDQYVPKA